MPLCSFVSFVVKSVCAEEEKAQTVPRHHSRESHGAHRYRRASAGETEGEQET
jgi:hypothetical protein